MAKKETPEKSGITKKAAPAKKSTVTKKSNAQKKAPVVRVVLSKPIPDLKGELWKPMKNCDRKYLISSMGRIKGFYFDSVNGTIVKGKNVNGYLALDIVFNGVRKMRYIHNLIAEHFIKKPNYKNAVVIHLNWKKEDNKVSNLQWYKQNDASTRTAQQNKKLALKGERYNLTSKLTKDQVIKIKEGLKKGILQSRLAVKFKISEMQISRIARGQSWSYIKI